MLELSDNAGEHSLHPPIPCGSGHAKTGSKRVLMQPHPQDLEAPTLKRFQTLSNEQLESLSKPSIPKNTKTATKWALDNFYSWMRHRNSTAKTATDKCPESILEDMDPKMLNKWLSAYIAEMRKVNGDPYPPVTLQSTLRVCCVTCEISMCQYSLGTRSTWCSVSSFSFASCFFYNSKNFFLRGGEEHKSLKRSQFTKTQNGSMYIENVSKICQGGISQVRLKNKWVEIRENSDAGERCHCRLLDLYTSKMPEDAKSKDLFYLRPLEKVKNDEGVWYYSAPVGRNKLSKMVSEMCKLAEIPGHHTNHSLRATGATELYTAGVPEKIIQERTGHRSVECLRMYEHTSDKQQHAVSNILSSSSELNYQSEMRKLEMCETHATSHSLTTIPNMTFNNCQVSINYNQGPSAPTYFNSQ